MTDAEFKEWLDNNQADVNTRADVAVRYLASKFDSPQLERIVHQLNDIVWTRESIPF